MTHLSCRGLFLVAVMLFNVSVALAEDEELAKSHFKLGMDLYNRSDYAGALVQFEKAYVYSNKPELKFNMARCHESLGNYKLALDAYEEYLRSNPPDQNEIKVRIANVRRLYEQKQSEENALREKAEKADAAQAEAARLRMLEEERRKRIIDPGPPWKSTRGLTGVIVGGVGVLAAGTGLIFGIMANSKASDLNSSWREGNRDYADYKDVEDQGKQFNTLAIVGLIGGGAAILAGGSLIAWHYLRPSESANHVWFEPTISPQGVTVSAGLTY